MKLSRTIITALFVCWYCVLSQAAVTNNLRFPVSTFFGEYGINQTFAFADFNGDGKADLALIDGGSILLHLGNGNGTFRAGIKTDVAGPLVSMTKGDFNHDGKMDIAVVQLFQFYDSPPFSSGGDDFGYGSAWILLGKGTGQFESPISYRAGNYCSSITSGDFNRDGILDLAVTSITTLQGLIYQGGLVMLFGNGNGTFRSGDYFETGENPSAIAASDFNRDGKLDLVVANDFGGTTVLLGDGDGSFNAITANYSTSGRPSSIVLGDFNLDGKRDFAAFNFDSQTYAVFCGRGNGTFASPKIIHLPEWRWNP